jgi:hypothetical protein
MCVIGHSDIRAILNNINAYIVASALIFAMCVIRHSDIRAILKNINAYIVESALIIVMCVVRRLVRGVV